MTILLFIFTVCSALAAFLAVCLGKAAQNGDRANGQDPEGDAHPYQPALTGWALQNSNPLADVRERVASMGRHPSAPVVGDTEFQGRQCRSADGVIWDDPMVNGDAADATALAWTGDRVLPDFRTPRGGVLWPLSPSQWLDEAEAIERYANGADPP